MTYYLTYVFLLLALFFSCDLYANDLEEHTKWWDTTVIIGSFTKTSRLRYYLEPQIRFIDNQYKFEEAFVLGGLGYQTTPDLILFLGDGWVTSKRSNGLVVHENRIWQQAHWLPINTNQLILVNRTRLEERKNLAEAEWAIRLRERLMLRLPLTTWEKHAFVCFDEVFFNLNHPSWIGSHAFFSQNRLFLGIGTDITKRTSFDVGYINQFIIGNQNQMNHILYFALNVNSV